MSIDVRFYDGIADERLKFAVILARYGGKWVFCKHKERQTVEIPGGHREPGETIWQAARRELYEETGAVRFEMEPVCAYGVVRENQPEESCGMLFFAGIGELEPELHSEIEKIVLLQDPPEGNWTYPEIQPRLLEEALRRKAVR